ncbi:MAG: putative Fe-S cluster assembly protein SufT [Gammaproteobacteria bacterium]|jgi:probable FeS assembly SUF system protein SufT|nr:putative Fe-S cluster assembly protein SufT [Gammaproteobacteria bacterium]MDP6616044.1 putative Fe-S cluster assembly protein SufT [Gammaproteobacteria bacterium]MDP6695481.1 putative Fe-S cluster assembly protein SufT [Gammaproteobacteria bacterium]
MFSQNSEPVVLKRDVKAIVVPAGMEVDLLKDSLVYITQAMGGSFTIYHEGNLFRIAGVDADALGKDPIKPPPLPENTSDEDFKSIVWDQIRTCYDPEIPVNIVDLGLIYDCEISRNGEGKRMVTVVMTLTAPGCGMGEILVEDVREKVSIIPTVAETEIELVFDPPWNREMMSETARVELGIM